MCGICGEIRFDGRAASVSDVQAVAQRLSPRGPDGAGVFARDRVAFAHRRLKIIDLSESSAQPMTDSELGLTLVFNGCIYNYAELRQELIAKGYRFFSKGDSEVILKAYHAWGTACVKRFQGMFAFALWEQHSGRVVLARDRLGIKPLYICHDDKSLHFSSSLTSLLTLTDIDKSINPTALHHYMSFHAVVPPPHTLINGIQKLPPATVSVIEANGSRSDETYWELSFNPQPGDEAKSEAVWQEEILAALRLAVKRRLVADVPVGVLLSGGLDSSLIVALLAEAGQSGLNTFSVGFESVNNEEGDEFRYSDQIADHFSTKHHKITIPTSEMLDALDDVIGSMSEPMVSHDNVGFYLLSREVTKQVKVVQSGQGADEVFAGYHWYPPLSKSSNPVADYARVFMDRSPEEMANTLQAKWLSQDFSRAFIEAHFARSGADDAVNKALRLDTTVMLVDDPVKRVDNMTMAWGLEARVPFLDHELVELAARTPAKLKMAQEGKGILKDVARGLVPDSVIDRPKGYFPVPALKYIKGTVLERVREALSGPTARKRNLFNPTMVETLLSDPTSHITPLRGSKLWQIALLELWLQKHNL
ncbi:MAG: N-acetylglutaminylglutamine amidotransferase [Magnetococcales bacterium]|nr:N-acetylglutaminylglutamine amidotransferase [Magnetococcales bacterium]